MLLAARFNFLQLIYVHLKVHFPDITYRHFMTLNQKVMMQILRLRTLKDEIFIFRIL